MAPGLASRALSLARVQILCDGREAHRLVSDNSFRRSLYPMRFLTLPARIPEVAAEIPSVVAEIPEVVARDSERYRWDSGRCGRGSRRRRGRASEHECRQESAGEIPLGNPR